MSSNKSNDYSMLMEHNIIVYENVKKSLLSNKCIVLETCTGSGKSYISGQLLLEFNWTGLVISPKRSIKNQWVELSEKYNLKLDSITYSKFCRLSLYEVEDYVYAYDIIILDEAHHVGAVKWGQNILYIRDNMNKYLLGLTADTIRWSDNKEDVSLSVFRDKVSGYTLGTAIDSNIIQPFEYICGIFDYSGISKSYSEKYSKYMDNALLTKLYGRLQHNLSNISNARNIIEKHLDKGNHKIIVFAENISACTDVIKYVESITTNVFVINSSKTSKENKQAISDFKSAKSAVIVCVNMLNEGVHLDDIDVLIMLRKTRIPSMFMQWIGRAMSAGNTSRVKIFDFVGNISNLESIGNMETSEIGYGGYCTWVERISDQIIISDYLRPINELVKILDWLKMTNRPWIDIEDDYLWSNVECKSIKEMAGELYRTYDSVKTRISRLGISEILRDVKEYDRNEMIELIEEVYMDDTIAFKRQYIYSMFPDMTTGAIDWILRSIRPGYKDEHVEMTDEDKRIIDEMWKDHTYSDISKALGGRHSSNYIGNYIRRNYDMKLRNPNCSNRNTKCQPVDKWIEQNGDKFIELFALYKNNWNKYKDVFPDVSYKRFRNYASKLGLMEYGSKSNRYTYDELIELQEKGIKEFMKENQRHTEDSVRDMYRKIKTGQVDIESYKNSTI